MPSIRRRSGFTLIELLVVIAIIAILAAILFPVFARARENARKSTCQNNQKQIGTALMQYVQDYDETYPYDPYGNAGTYSGDPFTNGQLWARQMDPYIKNTTVFQCPSGSPMNTSGAPNNHLLGYWMNGAIFYYPSSRSGVPMAAVTAPADVVVLYDSLDATNRGQEIFRPFWNNSGPWTDTGTLDILVNGNVRQGPHSEVMNVLWADGHVKAIKNRALKGALLTSRVWP